MSAPGGYTGRMDIDRLLEHSPAVLQLTFYVLCLMILVGLVFAILRTPREIKKNRAVLTKILSALRSIDRHNNET